MSRTTVESLTAALERARQKERGARADAARLAREMSVLSRKRETQRLCTLGRAWESLGAHSEQHRTAMQRFLADYISRDTDREILRGTPWQVPEPQQHASEPTYAQHEPTYHE